MAKRDPTENPVFRRILTDQRSPLRQLILQSNALTALQKKVLACVPPELHEHVIVVGVRDQSLLLNTDSGVWAARLRQLQETLVRTLQRQMPELCIGSVTIKVRPRSSARKATRKANRISQENAQLLLQEAEQTKDEGLQRVLRSIARHTRDAD